LTTAVVFTCAHVNPKVDNHRFNILGELLWDIKPDMVIDLGDFDDMASLNSYDTRYPKQIVSQSYQSDIEAGQNARERIWHRYKQNKKRLPLRIGFEGNHEHRIKKALGFDPRLEGDKFGISFKHLQTDYWYDEYHEYKNDAPAIVSYDGIAYSHYFSSGNYGSAISGTHHAYQLLQNKNASATCGHSHKRSIYFKDGSLPSGIIGLVAGCYKGADETWAGQSNSDWWKGVVIKRNIDNGMYDPEFVSLSRLTKEYY
jgi:hypothetical protein